MGGSAVTMTPLRSGDPDRLGRYRLLGRLGAGGMGTVFLGSGPDGQRVAVKAIRPEWSADPAFLARFRSEVKRAREVPPARDCGRPGCPGEMQARDYRLPPASARHGERAHSRLLRIWTCEECGAQVAREVDLG